MGRACDILFRIGTGEVTDYGFHLNESPLQVSAPLREYETQEYPETSTPEILLKTVKKPYEHEVKLVYYGGTGNFNAAMKTFWDSMFTATGDVLVPNEVEIYNYLKLEKIVGYPKELRAEKWGFDTVSDTVLFSLVFYVSDPALCDHDLSPIRIATVLSSATKVDVTVDTGGTEFTAVTIERSEDLDTWTAVYSGPNKTYQDTVSTSKTYYYRAKTNAEGYSYITKITT